MKIIRNAARCRACNAEIVSEYRWDFVKCPCGKIFVDGGLDYLRRGFERSYEDFEERSVWYEESFEEWASEVEKDGSAKGLAPLEAWMEFFREHATYFRISSSILAEAYLGACSTWNKVHLTGEGKTYLDAVRDLALAFWDLGNNPAVEPEGEESEEE